MWIGEKSKILQSGESPKEDQSEIQIPKSKFQKISVIAVTASALKQDEEVISMLCDGYLRKPVSRSDLIREMMKFLPHKVAKALELDERAASEKAPAEITRESLTELPADLLKRMRDAVRGGYAGQMSRLIDEAAQYDARLAQGLHQMAENYDYDGLSKFLGDEIPGENF